MLSSRIEFDLHNIVRYGLLGRGEVGHGSLGCDAKVPDGRYGAEKIK